MTRTRTAGLTLLLTALLLAGCGGGGGGEPTVTQTVHDELQAELDAALAALAQEREAKAQEKTARDAAEAIGRNADSSRTTHAAEEAVDACRYACGQSNSLGEVAGGALVGPGNARGRPGRQGAVRLWVRAANQTGWAQTWMCGRLGRRRPRLGLSARHPGLLLPSDASPARLRLGRPAPRPGGRAATRRSAVTCPSPWGQPQLAAPRAPPRLSGQRARQPQPGAGHGPTPTNTPHHRDRQHPAAQVTPTPYKPERRITPQH